VIRYKVNGLIFVLSLSAFSTAPLAAQYRGLSLGLGGELNGVTIYDDISPGMALAVESRLNRYFALDLHGAAGSPVSKLRYLGTDNVFLGFETLGFLRLYLFSPLEMDTPKGFEAFIGAGAGLIATMNTTDVHNSRGSLELAGKIGVRFRIGEHFYIEPYIRGGYPFMVGGGLIAGFRFPVDSFAPSARGEREITVAATTTAARGLSCVECLFIVFQPDKADFTDLKYKLVDQNTTVLNNVSSLLKDHPSTRLRIGGAVYEDGGEQILNESRVKYIADILLALSVPPDRIVTTGEYDAITHIHSHNLKKLGDQHYVELCIFQ
jgi:hypothetical protein